MLSKKCFLSLFLIGSMFLLAMDRNEGLELVLCAIDTPTEVLQIIYEKLTEINEYAHIPRGDYWIGSPETEARRNRDEKLHQVTLSSFSIMKHEGYTGTIRPKDGQESVVFPLIGSPMP